jgi:hypothetical protein
MMGTLLSNKNGKFKKRKAPGVRFHDLFHVFSLHGAQYMAHISVHYHIRKSFSSRQKSVTAFDGEILNDWRSKTFKTNPHTLDS